jgi:hypothetical protein
MRPSEVWNRDTVIIETGMHDGVIGTSLLADGVTNYLGVSSDAKRIEAIQQAEPQLAPCTTSSPWQHYMPRNNAQVLILSGFTSLFVWRYRVVRHAHQIAWKAGFNPVSLLATLGWFIYASLFRRYGVPKLVTCTAPNGKSRYLLVSQVLRMRPRAAARHFVPHALGLGGLFEKFEQLGVKYAVLRWFEALPKIRQGKDIDMLLADESLEQVREILNSQPGIQTTDIYTPSGLPKSDFYSTPYYPTERAREVLTRTVWHKQYCRIPSPIDHFHTLAYHGVYHNGGRSGLKSRTGAVKSVENPKHDYVVILGEMARKLGIEVEFTLEGLREYLAKAGWAPQPDMLARMAAHYPKNPWVKHLAASLNPVVHEPGLTVFCIRQKAVEWGFADKIISMLEQGGWKTLAKKELSPDEIARTAKLTRGGNWEKGFYKTSSGPPSVIVVSYDPQPIKPTRAQLRKDTRIVNARLFLKDEIRAKINKELPPEEECSALHSTDYGGESWYFIEVYMPELMAEIREKIRQLRGESSTSTTYRRAA